MRILKNVCYADGGCEAQMLDIYLPDCEGFPIFVFFHGGGFEKCDKGDSFAEVLSKYFTSHGIGFVSANYRMYPNARFPDYVEDGASAVAFIGKKARELGGDGRLFVGGSSAGGYLSMLLCYDNKYLGAHGIAPLEITAFIHDAGQPTTHFNVLRERGIKRFTCRVDEAAPLFHVGEAESYPYQLFFVSDRDVKCRLEETRLLIATLGALKYDTSKIKLRLMEGYGHTEYLDRTDTDGESIFGKEVLSFLIEKKLI